MRNKFLWLATLALAGVQFANATKVTDDSVWINSDITSAIESGKTQLSLPAGTYVLQHPIVIPPGTNNFTLKGAGSGKTILTSPDVAQNYLILVGDWVQLYNNWNITNRTNYPVSPVGEGARTIKVAPKTALQAGKYYVLWDNNALTVLPPATDLNHAEIVKLTSYNSRTGVATLDEPAGRSYNSSASLADVGKHICTNITVEGIGMNGAMTGSIDASYSLVLVGIADHVTLNDLKVQTYHSYAIRIVNARNVFASNLDIEDATNSEEGSGYGVAVQRSRFVTIENSTCTKAQQGFMGHSGSMDVLFRNCVANQCGLDLHGMDERRITFQGCSTDTTIQIGNQSWEGGAKDISIQGGQFGMGIITCANTLNVEVSLAHFLNYQPVCYFHNQTTLPPNQYPDQIHFTKCSFTAPYYLIRDCPQIGTVSFSDCSFEATFAPWSNIAALTQMSSNSLSFTGCTFKNDSSRGDTPFVFSDNYASGLNLSITNSTIIGNGGAKSAVSFYKKFLGNVVLKGNVLQTTGKGPSFYQNQSSASVSASGNSITK